MSHTAIFSMLLSSSGAFLALSATHDWELRPGGSQCHPWQTWRPCLQQGRPVITVFKAPAQFCTQITLTRHTSVPLCTIPPSGGPSPWCHCVDIKRTAKRASYSGHIEKSAPWCPSLAARQEIGPSGCTARRQKKKKKPWNGQPLPSPHCAASPPHGLPSAPWSGRDLARASGTAQIHANRRKRLTHFAGILAATCLLTAPRPRIHAPIGRSRAASRRRHGSDAGLRMMRCCREPCGLRLVCFFYCLSLEERSICWRKEELRLRALHTAATRAWWEIN